MVLGQVQDQAVAVNLHVQRQVRAEAVLPVQAETEEIHVELPGLVDREDAQYRDGGGEGHGASLTVGKVATVPQCCQELSASPAAMVDHPPATA
ncbi:hypothetical protein D3C79_932050 [compost metagenome]